MYARDAVRVLKDFTKTLPEGHRDRNGAELLLVILEANPAGVMRAIEILNPEYRGNQR